MRLFECQACHSALHFDNTVCLTCRRRVGYLQDRLAMSALDSGPAIWNALGAAGERYRFCANADDNVCNWMLPEAELVPFLRVLPA